MASAVLNERANIHNMTPSTPSSADQSTALRDTALPSNGGASSRIENLEPAPPSTQLSATKAAAIADDGWESVEVEEMGAVVAPATPSSIAAVMATHGASASSPFGSLMSSPPLQQQLHLSSLHAANPILVNNAAASPPKTTSNGGNLGPQLSYLQIAGSLMTSSTSTLAAANSSSPFSRPGLSNHQIVSTTSTPTPLVHPPPSASPFAFVPKPTTRDGHDGFKDAFEQARDKLHLFERRFGGDDGRETTTTASSTQDAAAAASATPTKGGDGKRKRSDEEADGENKRKEKKKAKKDEQSKKKQKQKKDKKSSKTVKKEDGSASLALDEKPEGGFTFMQGAYYILKREHRFMTAKEIVAIGVAEDLFASSKGKTPEATVAAGIYVDLKKPVSQFCQGCKVGKRGFGLSEWKDLESIPGPPDTPVKTRRRTAKADEVGKKKKQQTTSTTSRRTKKREEEEEARRRRQALLEEEDAEEDEEDEEIEEEMVIVEEEEDDEESAASNGTATPSTALRPLPFGSPLAF